LIQPEHDQADQCGRHGTGFRAPGGNLARVDGFVGIPGKAENHVVVILITQVVEVLESYDQALVIRVVDDGDVAQAVRVVLIQAVVLVPVGVVEAIGLDPKTDIFPFVEVAQRNRVAGQQRPSPARLRGV